MLRKKCYGVTEIADALNVGVASVRRWIDTGKLEGYKPAGEYFVTDRGLREFLGTGFYSEIVEYSKVKPQRSKNIMQKKGGE